MKKHNLLLHNRYILSFLSLLFIISTVESHFYHNSNKQLYRRIREAPSILSPTQEHAYNCLNSPVLIMDLNGNIEYTNQALAEIIDQDLIGNNIAQLIGLSNSKILDEHIEEGLKSNNLSETLKFQVKLQDNTTITLELNISFLTDTSNNPLGITVSLHDVTNKFIDSLTGLYNRLYFAGENDAYGTDSALTDEINLAKRNGPVSLILLDIDHFKQVNDTYGHFKGDEVLQAVARKLQEIARDTDSIYRWGGEEIAITAFNTTTQEAAILAERIIESFQIPTAGLNISVSMGISTYDKNDTRFSEDPHSIALQIFEEADSALYYSKENGRNRYTLFPLSTED